MRLERMQFAREQLCLTDNYVIAIDGVCAVVPPAQSAKQVNVAIAKQKALAVLVAPVLAPAHDVPLVADARGDAGVSPPVQGAHRGPFREESLGRTVGARLGPSHDRPRVVDCEGDAHVSVQRTEVNGFAITPHHGVMRSAVCEERPSDSHPGIVQCQAVSLLATQ
jgi:hypothetical protein